MMNIELLNMDLDYGKLNDVVNFIDNSENITYKEINDILCNLDMYNISVRINNITMMQYTLLLTMKGIKPILLKQKELKFGELTIDDKDIQSEYKRLLNEYKELRKELDIFSDTTLECLEPGSRLVDIEMNTSIKEFIEFINTCSKYDELLDLVLVISTNEITQKFISILYKLDLNTYDVYMRSKIVKEVRDELTSLRSSTKSFIISNTDYISRELEKGNSEVKISLLTYSNYLEIRDLTNKFIDINIKLENPKLIEKENYPIDVIVPDELGLINDEILTNRIDKYIYDWIVLISKIKDKKEYYYNDILACYLGCFASIFIMNNSVKDYFNLQYTDIGSQVVEMLYSLIQNI